MAIDIEKELAAAVAEHGKQYGPGCCEVNLLKGILRRRSLTDFHTVFDYFSGIDGGEYLNIGENLRPLLSPWWMSHLEVRHLVWMYEHLIAEYDSLSVIEKLLADRRIAPFRRAVLYHAVFDAEEDAALRVLLPRRNGIVVLPNFWWDNHRLWEHQVERNGRDCPDASFRRLGLPFRTSSDFSAALHKTMIKDCVSAFEMTRRLENRRISDSMMAIMIMHNSADCFAYLLAHYPERVFNLRSPEEWLITVCREARQKLAVAAVNELEREFPGVVRRTRDPWGNTPLWNTFFNLEPTEKLRAELIRFGCDPDEKNEWGLSYRLLRDNAPEIRRKKTNADGVIRRM